MFNLNFTYISSNIDDNSKKIIIRVQTSNNHCYSYLELPLSTSKFFMAYTKAKTIEYIKISRENLIPGPFKVNDKVYDGLKYYDCLYYLCKDS